MIYVAIVEDNDDIRESLALLIEGTKGYSCSRSYGDCESAIQGLTEDLPDIILMDIGLPGMSGIECIRKIRETLSDIDIIVLTIYSEDESVFDALCAGASGYLLKNNQPSKLLEAIEEVNSGGAPMSTEIARKVVRSFHTRRPPSLTNRENEVLTELCTAKTYKMIADTLFISEETVRRHIKSIYRKLGVHSQVEAVSKAIREKLV